MARIDGVSGQLNLAFTAMTGVGIVSGALKYFGLSGLVPWFLGLTGIGVLAFAYVYNEFGVRNQTSRDNTDLSTNYSGPTMLMDARLEARQLARLGYVLQNGHDRDVDEIEDELLEITHEEWAKFRDGVDVERIERRYRG
jgi:hypothetical protein